MWKLKVLEGSKALLVLEDGNDNVVWSKKIAFTDFPIAAGETFTLWAEAGDGLMTIMLPSER